MGLILTMAGATVREAVRNRLLWLAIALAVAGLGITQFLQQVAITETRQIEASLLAALLRWAAAFLMATFVVTSTVREWNDKVGELLFSLPEPRARYFFGKLAGFAAVAAGLTLVFSLPLAAFAPLRNLALWSVSLLCELLIVAAVGLFSVLTLTQVMASLAVVAAFYLLARTMTAMQIIAGASLIGTGSVTDKAVEWIVEAIALLLPNLDQMAQSSWLTGSPPNGPAMAAILLQTVVYLALISAAALFDLYRKNL